MTEHMQQIKLTLLDKNAPEPFIKRLSVPKNIAFADFITKILAIMSIGD